MTHSYVLVLTFSSMIYFEIISAHGVIKGKVSLHVAKFNSLLLYGF